MTVGIEGELSIQLGRLSKSLDDQTEEFKKARQARETARARAASLVRVQGSGIIPTPTAPLGMNLGGPDPGFEWVVRRIIVGGLTWTTTAAGTGEVYVTGLGAQWGSSAGGSGTVAGVRSLSDLVDQSTALPNKAFYGREELVVKESESLVVVVNGGTAGQQYSCSAGIQVVRTVSVAWGATQGI